MALDPYSIYMCVEQDNDVATKNGNLSVLQYTIKPSSGESASLVATRQWLITDFPTAPKNYGFEGITWLPDSFLVNKNFYDETKNKKYDPLDYPNHGTGLFFLGQETDGKLYSYALMLNGDKTVPAMIASIKNFDVSVMSLQFDKDNGIIWALCDNTCTSGKNIATYELNTSTGKFDISHVYSQPLGLSKYNNEGLAILRDETCSRGQKSVYFVDDDNTGGFSLRQGHIDCSPPSRIPIA